MIKTWYLNLASIFRSLIFISITEWLTINNLTIWLADDLRGFPVPHTVKVIFISFWSRLWHHVTRTDQSGWIMFQAVGFNSTRWERSLKNHPDCFKKRLFSKLDQTSLYRHPLMETSVRVQLYQLLATFVAASRDQDGDENVIALHVRFTVWYISLSSSAKQQRQMTKFMVLWRRWTHDG